MNSVKAYLDDIQITLRFVIIRIVFTEKSKEIAQFLFYDFFLLAEIETIHEYLIFYYSSARSNNGKEKQVQETKKLKTTKGQKVKNSAKNIAVEPSDIADLHDFDDDEAGIDENCPPEPDQLVDVYEKARYVVNWVPKMKGKKMIVEGDLLDFK